MTQAKSIVTKAANFFGTITLEFAVILLIAKAVLPSFVSDNISLKAIVYLAGATGLFFLLVYAINDKSKKDITILSNTAERIRNICFTLAGLLFLITKFDLFGIEKWTELVCFGIVGLVFTGLYAWFKTQDSDKVVYGTVDALGELTLKFVGTLYVLIFVFCKNSVSNIITFIVCLVIAVGSMLFVLLYREDGVVQKILQKFSRMTLFVGVLLFIGKLAGFTETVKMVIFVTIALVLQVASWLLKKKEKKEKKA